MCFFLNYGFVSVVLVRCSDSDSVAALRWAIESGDVGSFPAFAPETFKTLDVNGFPPMHYAMCLPPPQRAVVCEALKARGCIVPDATPDATQDVAVPDATPDVSVPDATPDVAVPDATPDATPDVAVPDVSEPALKRLRTVDASVRVVRILNCDYVAMQPLCVRDVPDDAQRHRRNLDEKALLRMLVDEISDTPEGTLLLVRFFGYGVRTTDGAVALFGTDTVLAAGVWALLGCLVCPALRLACLRWFWAVHCLVRQTCGTAAASAWTPSLHVLRHGVPCSGAGSTSSWLRISSCRKGWPSRSLLFLWLWEGHNGLMCHCGTAATAAAAAWTLLLLRHS